MNQIIKSVTDNSIYKCFKLSNLIKVVLISNKIFKSNTISLSVNVGSNDDPRDIPGLSHFLEHMLFMGTGKYQDENDFIDFVGKHGGVYNAFTKEENTVYSCTTNPEYLDELADRFSNFFIDPLIKESCVQREMSAVHSEFLRSKNFQEAKIRNLFNQFTRSDDPRGKFSLGNNRTLSVNNIRDRLYEHWKSTYSSDGMCLVITGCQPIKELKRVAWRFKFIENRNYSGVKKHAGFDIYDPKFHTAVVKCRSFDDSKYLVVSLYAPEVKENFKKQAYKLIAQMLEDTSKATNISFHLKAHGFISELFFNHEILKEHTRVDVIFKITQKGSQQYKSILNTLVKYLRLVRPDHYSYLRFKKINELKFKYSDIPDPYSLAASVCENMQLYPLENVLNHDQCFDDFDPEYIQAVINDIADYRKWVILLIDDSGIFDSVDEHYSTEYTIVEKYEYSDPDFYKPSFDSGLCLDFEREATRRGHKYYDNIQVIRKEVPRFSKFKEFEDGRILYVFDQKYSVPKSYITVTLKSQEMFRKCHIYEMYLKRMELIFAVPNLDFIFDGLNFKYTAKIRANGLELGFEGYSETIACVIENFISTLFSFKADTLADVRNETITKYKQELSSDQYSRLFDVYDEFVLGIEPLEKRMEHLKNLKDDDIQITKVFYTEITAVGNIEYSEIVKLYENIRSGGRNFESSSSIKEYSKEAFTGSMKYGEELLYKNIENSKEPLNSSIGSNKGNSKGNVEYFKDSILTAMEYTRESINAIISNNEDNSKDNDKFTNNKYCIDNSFDYYEFSGHDYSKDYSKFNDNNSGKENVKDNGKNKVKDYGKDYSKFNDNNSGKENVKNKVKDYDKDYSKFNKNDYNNKFNDNNYSKFNDNDNKFNDNNYDNKFNDNNYGKENSKDYTKFNDTEYKFKTEDFHNNFVAIMFRATDNRNTPKYKIIPESIENLNSKIAVDEYDEKFLKRQLFMLLVVQMYRSRFFDELRIKEEFGYIVKAMHFTTFESSNLVFLVQSEKSVETIKGRIFSFISDLKRDLSTMDSRVFEKSKECLSENLLDDSSNLKSFSSRVFLDYKYGYFDLNLLQKKLLILESMDINDMLKLQEIFEDPIIIYSEHEVNSIRG